MRVQRLSRQTAHTQTHTCRNRAAKAAYPPLLLSRLLNSFYSTDDKHVAPTTKASFSSDHTNFSVSRHNDIITARRTGFTFLRLFISLRVDLLRPPFTHKIQQISKSCKVLNDVIITLMWVDELCLSFLSFFFLLCNSCSASHVGFFFFFFYLVLFLSRSLSRSHIRGHTRGPCNFHKPHVIQNEFPFLKKLKNK